MHAGRVSTRENSQARSQRPRRSRRKFSTMDLWYALISIIVQERCRFQTGNVFLRWLLHNLWMLVICQMLWSEFPFCAIMFDEALFEIMKWFLCRKYTDFRSIFFASECVLHNIWMLVFCRMLWSEIPSCKIMFDEDFIKKIHQRPV